jgi:hypothetical protein
MIVDSVFLWLPMKNTSMRKTTTWKRLPKRTCNSIKRHVEQLKLSGFIPDRKSWFCITFYSYRTCLCNGTKWDTTLYNKAFENIVIVIQPLYWLLCEPLTVCGQTKTTRKCLWDKRQAGALYDKFEGLFWSNKNRKEK